MTPAVQWLASESCTRLVETLLHTLWQGALFAVGLWAVLRQPKTAQSRYRWSLAALLAVTVCGFLTWGILQDTTVNPGVATTALAEMSATVVSHGSSAAMPDIAPVATPAPTIAARVGSWSVRWSGWLAIAWMAGAVIMLVRAGLNLAGAERLRRSCQPLTERPVIELLRQTQSALGIVRQVRVAVTDQLTSPAVVGVLVPTLILPLSVATTFSPEQLRFILLHELAHIRRGDYLTNLFQLLVESLLFFNPAVWWMSRQVRIEREACCDALSVELSGKPADYARTLLQVAERAWQGLPAAMPAFADEPEPASLRERVSRTLIPGYRPNLRLSWRGMVLAAFAGGILLFLTAMGARWTIARASAFLTPRQRLQRIERALASHGEKLQLPGTNQVEVSGVIRTADKGPLPKYQYLNATVMTRQNSSVGTTMVTKDGKFKQPVREGELWITMETPGYAPTFLGPINTQGKTKIDNLELVAQRGFNISVRVVDADTGEGIPGAAFNILFGVRRSGGTSYFQPHELTAGADGVAVIDHAADLSLRVTAKAPGYEITEQNFDTLKAGQALTMRARRGEVTTGEVRDKATGTPVAAATISVLWQRGPAGEFTYGWEDRQRVLCATDAMGRFSLSQLRGDSKYIFRVSAPGHASIIQQDITAGKSNLVIQLEPELVVRGRLTGNLDQLETQGRNKSPYLSFNWGYRVNESGHSFSSIVPVRREGGVGYFTITNPIAGIIDLTIGKQKIQRLVEAAIDDWEIEITNAAPETPIARRTVVLQFTGTSGVPPRGTIKTVMPEESGKQNYYVNREVEIHDGQAKVEVPVGGRFEYEPSRTTVGYWFQRDWQGVTVPPGSTPLVIKVPVIPAGAIQATARNTDGTPSSDLMFSLQEIKRSPLVTNTGGITYESDSRTSDSGPRRYVSGPLPLGGTYQLVGWRGNSFCLSKTVTLTDESPLQELQLQFSPTRAIEGVLLSTNGQPIAGIDVGGSWLLEGHGFGLKACLTDWDGHFRLEDATPNLGKYVLQISGIPHHRSTSVTVDFKRLPLKIQLEPGLILSGTVKENGTGNIIPDAEVRVFEVGGGAVQEKTKTDAAGHFEFTTLSDTTYFIYVQGGNMVSQNQVRPGKKPITLEVTPYPGGNLVPKPAPTNSVPMAAK